MPEIVVTDPLPVDVTPPGVRVTVHVPDSGNPVNGTLPAATEQVGCKAKPVIGAEGVTGWTFITAARDDAEVQPDEFVTVNVYVPEASDEIVVVVPVPEVVIFPGDLVNVHVPEEGRPLMGILPVATPQVG
jgi:hypothetical protein